MSFNNENYYKLREEFEDKRRRKQQTASDRAEELRGKIEGLSELDAALAATASRIFGAALGDKEGLESRIEQIRKETKELRGARGDLLKANGYPADYTDIHYDCDKCDDTGFTDTKMCDCFRRALILRGYETSGIAKLMAKQTFETFSLDYYKGDAKTHADMVKIYNTVKNYADTFSPQKSGSLLFMGGTGLGKTHLSSALAKALIDRGFDVLYSTAMHIISDFEKTTFHNGEDNAERYFGAELLIVDDLGTELGGSFTVTCLYDLLNTRICRGLPTVVSTNLKANQISEKYGERVFSRLLGEYQPLVFGGRDIRFEKGN